MLSFFKGFLRFSDAEYRGSMALALVTMASLIALQVVPACIQHEPLIVVKPAEEELRDFPSAVQPAQAIPDVEDAPVLFQFDPNHLPVEAWMKLGLSRKQAESIHRYESAGGSFRKKEDVLNLFVVDEERYNTWKEFIHIPEREVLRPVLVEEPPHARKSLTENSESVPLFTEVLLDLNRADTSDLRKLHGVGAYTARQIVWYREKLGGYANPGQLEEVKGIRPENLERILGQVEIKDDPEGKVDINRWDVKQLARHPYISWNQAKSLVAFRDQHGAYTSWEGLLRNHLITSEDSTRLSAYIRFSQVETDTSSGEEPELDFESRRLGH